MSSLFSSSPVGSAGGSGLFRFLAAFDDMPESEFYDDVDDSLLLVLESLDFDLEVVL